MAAWTARLVKIWPCLASALLVNLAFPPVNLGLIVFVALAPWLASLRNATGREGFRSGWTFGFFVLLGQFFWLFTFVNRWTQSFFLSLLPYLAACAMIALYFAIAGWQIALSWRKGMPWAIPLVWAGVEILRSYTPGLAFPYSLIATPLWPYPQIIQSAYYGSIFMVGAWVVLANVFFATFLTGEGSWARMRNYAAVFVLGAVISLVRYQTPVPTGRAVVTIGQPGVDLAFGDRTLNDFKLRDAVADFYAKAQVHQADLLVLPEGIGGKDGWFPPRPVFQVEAEPPVIFGGQRGDDPRYQTAFAYDGKWSYADKSRLVMFGEYVPLRKQLPFIASAFNLPSGDLVPADKVTALKVGKLTVGPILCFEGLFPDIAYRQAQNGAQMLVVMSVDDWYFGTAAPDQLRAGSIWRAVETGLPLVRSASLGYSLAVDPRGHLVGTMPLRETNAARVELPIGEPTKPFPLFPIFPGIALLSLLAVPIFAKRESPNSESVVPK